MNKKALFFSFLKDRFGLEKNQEEHQAVIDSITRNIYFKGTNLWVLIFAIFIASIGLNVNSTAVIIGAMLISPLMGPIMGIGLGAGINNFRLMRLSAANFLVSILIGLITSTIYFLFTPLYEAHSELLARTTPTVYDVFIALFGGLAGIVATSTREKGNVIPGVAIATALMPPLCTAGYGLSIGNIFFFLGAIYLFLINSVFICLATFLIVRFLRFPMHQYPDPKTGKKMKLWIWLIVVCTFLPSVVIAYFMVQKNIFETNARRFISKEMVFDGNTIIDRTIDTRNKTIRVVYVGKGITPELEEHARRKLPDYNLRDVKLNIHQGMKELSTSDISSMKSQIIEELYTKDQEILFLKDQKINRLEKELAKYKSGYFSGAILSEIRALFPQVGEASISRSLIRSDETRTTDTICLVYLKLKKKASRKDLSRLDNWLHERLKGEKIKMVVVP